jgi:hypothetical protein
MRAAPTLAIPSPAASLFHTATGTAFTDIEIEGHRETHRETWPVRGKQLRAWLRRRYYQQTGEALGGETIRSMVDLLEARAPSLTRRNVRFTSALQSIRAASIWTSPTKSGARSKLHPTDGGSWALRR